MKSNRILGLLLLGGSVLAAETVMEVIPLQNRPAAEIQPLLQPLLESEDRVVDDGANLIVKTSPQRLESLRALIGQLDTPLHNLVISVIQNSFQSAAELNSEAAIAVSPSAIRMQGMNADTRELDRRRSTQQLRTLEGQAAHIEVGRERPVETVTVYGSGYGYPSVTSTTQLQTASTGFAVIPRLVGSGEVMIGVEPWSDRFHGNGAIATQNAGTSVRVRLGEWVDLAGVNNVQRGDSQGFNGLNYTTGVDERHILIKVDLAD